MRADDWLGSDLWPPIMMAVDMGALKRRALAGDKRAVAILAASAPAAVPSRVLRAERDRIIAGIGAWLYAALPGATVHAAATIVAAASAEAAQGRRLRPRPPLDRLNRHELLELQAKVRDLLNWIPEAGRRGAGIGLRSVLESLQFSRWNLQTFSCSDLGNPEDNDARPTDGFNDRDADPRPAR